MLCNIKNKLLLNSVILLSTTIGRIAILLFIFNSITHCYDNETYRTYHYCV